MEREFLGIGGNDFLVKEDGRGVCKDAALVALQWPFSNKITSLQQFMSYRAAQEKKQKKVVYDQLSSSGFQPTSTADALDNNYRCSSALVSQKSFSADRQDGDIHQFSVPAYPSQGTDSFVSLAHQSTEARMFPAIPHHSIPIATTSPFFKIYGSPIGPNHTGSSSKQQSPFGGGVAVTNSSVGTPGGAFAPRNIAKPSATTAQLTMFYAGAVNVYDDISLEKAQAIMFLAGNGTNMAANSESDRAEAPVLGVEALNMKQTQFQTNGKTLPCSSLSSPISVTSHSVSQSGGGHSKNDDMMVAKTNGPLVHTSHHEPPKTTTTPVSSAAGAALKPTAVPQARQASLARFLEKRKERVTNAAPYTSSHKSTEKDVRFDGMNLSTNSAEVALLSSSSKPLNTKLEMWVDN